MTLPGGAPHHPSAATLFDRLMGRQATAAVAISGADHSSWTGVWRETSNGGNVLATATWDCDIEYADTLVRRLREMCENAGRQHDPETLRGYRRAVEVMLHENGHLLNQAGRRHTMSRQAFQNLGNAAYEEGLTQVWTTENLPGYIAELGLEQIAPGISAVTTDQIYPQYVGATKVLTDQLGRHTGLGGPEVRRRLVGLDAETRWPATAQLVFTTSGLADIVPLDHHAWAKETLQFTMQSHFGHLSTVTGSMEQAHVASVAIGHQAAASVRRQVETLRRVFGGRPDPQHTFQNLLSRQAEAALAISGADHSSWNGRVEQTTDGSPTAARWDGTLSYDVATVTGPLWEMSNNDSRPQDPATLARYKYAVQTMLQHNAHLLAGPGREHAMGASGYQDRSAAAFDWGVTEAWAAAHTNDYIAALGLEGVAPGISGVELPPSQTHHGAAASALATELGRHTGLGRDVVLTRLNNVDAAEKWPTAAQLVFDYSTLPASIPPDRHAAAKAQIQQSMQAHFTGLPDLTGDPLDRRLAAATAGQAAVDSARATVQGISAQHNQPALSGGPSPAAATHAVTPDLERTMAAAYAGTGTLSGVQPSGPTGPAGDRVRPDPGGPPRPGPAAGRG